MAGANDKRLAGFVPIGIFFYFGATMATYAAITLAVPGTFLDHAWKLNSEGHVGLAALGRIMAVPLLVLAAALLLCGTRLVPEETVGMAVWGGADCNQPSRRSLQHRLPPPGAQGFHRSSYRRLAADLYEPETG
jgi:hypothetical protein